MFDWIKNLKKSGRRPAPVAHPDGNDSGLKTRVVKRIVPAGLRETENAEASATAVATAEPPHVAVPLMRISPAPLPISPLRVVKATTAKITTPPLIPFPGNTPAFAVEPEAIEAKADVAVHLANPVEMPVEETPVAAPRPAGPIRLTTPSAPSARPAMPSIPVPAKEVVLTIGDFIAGIPSHFINEEAVDKSTEVHFPAADLYSDMSKGKATVPLSVIAENVPRIFKRMLSPEEDIEVQLPLSKIVGQMTEFLTLPDQEAAESYEEIDTPFRKAALRDGAVHNGSSAAIQKPAPPAEIPASVAAESSRPRPKPINFNASPEVAPPTPPAPPAALPVAERLPAVPAPKKPSGLPGDHRRVTVRVRPLIQALPTRQRESLLGSIPEDSEVDLPLSEIEEQLPSGRVVLPFATFAAALKPELRSTFTDNYSGEDVPISLSEIIKNLPHESLGRRKDQVIETVDPNEFETPFNTTPNEMPAPAVRPAMAVSPALRAKPVITPSLPPSVSYTTRKLNADTSYPSPMHAALLTRDALDAKKVVKLAAGLPGVAGMTIITNDGLSLAGNLPAFMNPEGFTAMAPQLLRRLSGQVADMKLGELQHLTLYTETHTITIVTSGAMTLAVLHQNQADLGHGVREKLIAIICELSRQYAE